MAHYNKIGDKLQIMQAKQERASWETLIGNISNMTEGQLDTWFTNHFSGLSGDIQRFSD